MIVLEHVLFFGWMGQPAVFDHLWWSQRHLQGLLFIVNNHIFISASFSSDINVFLLNRLG